MNCPHCHSGRLAQLDEDDALGCLVCGERVYTTPLQLPPRRHLSPELVARIRRRWGERDRKPVTVVAIADALTVLLGSEISEAAIRHVLKNRTWRDAAMQWLVGLQLVDYLDDGALVAVQLVGWLAPRVAHLVS